MTARSAPLDKEYRERENWPKDGSNTTSPSSSVAANHGADNPSGELRGNSPASGGSRHDILQAAAHCFKENGFAATSIDDVARSLGATKGMIYHHFRSKTDLFFAVYRRGMELNDEATLPHVEGNGSALERLTRMAFAHAVALMVYQPFQRVLAQGVAMHQTGSTTAAQRETLVELIESRDRYEARFRKLIKQTSQEEGFEVSDLSVASKSFLAVVNSTVFWYRESKDSAAEERNALARKLVTFALQGLGATINPGAIEALSIETLKLDQGETTQ